MIQDTNVYTALNGLSHSIELYGQYIYLGNDERRRFNINKHNYLIEQVQYNSKRIGDVTSGENVGKNVLYKKLTFNHPVKQLFWCATTQNARDGRKKYTKQLDFLQLSNNKGDYDGFVQFKTNGINRFSNSKGHEMSYFTRLQPYFHSNKVSIDDTIATYSFALYPYEHQPSGTFNFSRVDNFEMTINYQNYSHYSDYYTDFNATGGTINITDGTSTQKVTNTSISGHLMVTGDNLPYDWKYKLTTAKENVIFHIFAMNYNILKIMGGQGGLQYNL